MSDQFKNELEKTEIQLGYIPLLDCVALLWAKQQGYFEEVGLNVHLVKEASWASLRDRLAYGILDAAHCLSAMLPAAHLNEDQIGIPLQTPLILSSNCAFISLKQSLCFDLKISSEDSPQHSAEKIIDALKAGHSIQLASVFKHSIHHYCLREWLALADPYLAHNITLATLPPPYMVEAIKRNIINGFCVGEPWNTQAELEGISQIISSSREIIPNIADKVLAFTSEWTNQHPNTVKAIIQAIKKAQDELKYLEDYQSVWTMLMDYKIIRFECSNTVHVQKFYSIQNIIRNFIQDSAQPRIEDFKWLIGQMQKWNGLDLSAQEILEMSKQCMTL